MPFSDYVCTDCSMNFLKILVLEYKPVKQSPTSLQFMDINHFSHPKLQTARSFHLGQIGKK